VEKEKWVIHTIDDQGQKSTRAQGLQSLT